MAQLSECPYGFEDGYIISYEVDSERLLLTYKFWNEQEGMLAFDGLAALRHVGAVGAEIGGVAEDSDSELLTELLKHDYESPPAATDLTCFRFLDVGDFPVLEVIARSARFCGKKGDALR